MRQVFRHADVLVVAAVVRYRRCERSRLKFIKKNLRDASPIACKRHRSLGVASRVVLPAEKRHIEFIEVSLRFISNSLCIGMRWSGDARHAIERSCWKMGRVMSQQMYRPLIHSRHQSECDESKLLNLAPNGISDSASRA